MANFCTNLYRVFIVVSVLSGCGGDSTARSDEACKRDAKGRYPSYKTSAYILPWQVGETYKVGQGNCTFGSHREDSLGKYAYDFPMPLGTSIVASRAGTVVHVVESHVDGTGIKGEENVVVIEHDDGSIAIYGHLTTLGAQVEKHQEVAQGDLIGLSGNSGGSTAPHLHFHVESCTQKIENCTREAVPINFSNTHAHIDGLVQGKSYRAL